MLISLKKLISRKPQLFILAAASALYAPLTHSSPLDIFKQNQAAQTSANNSNGNTPVRQVQIKKNILEQYKETSKTIVEKAISGDLSNNAFSSAGANQLTPSQIKLTAETKEVKENIKESSEVYSKLKQKMIFVKAVKSITLKEKDRYIDIFVPFLNRSTIEFDQPIKSFEMFRHKGAQVKREKESTTTLSVKNEDPDLILSVKIDFLSGRVLTLVLKTGDSPANRHVEYKIITDSSSVASRTLFVKKTKVKNIHNDFNNKAMLLVLSRIQEDEFYNKIRKNIIPLEKVLFEGTGKVSSAFGKKNINYSIVLNSVFESAFVQPDKKDKGKKNRLVMLEMTITNNSLNESLTVNETLIINRFANYVVMWLGDLDKKENVVSPSESIRIIVVISDQYDKSKTY